MESTIASMIVAGIVLLLGSIGSGQACDLPCGKKGVCVRLSETSAPMCACTRCWTGTYCDTPITSSACPSSTSTARRIVVVNPGSGTSGRDICDPNPCRGRGYCQADPTKRSRFRCTCVNRRSGTRCQKLMQKPRDPCRESTTLCSGGICHSPPDMIGHMCMSPRTPPTEAPPVIIAITAPCDRNPCEGSGYCQVAPDRPERFLCTCVNNRDGTRCENLLPSPRNPCRESSTLCSGGICHSPPTMIGHMCSPSSLVTDPRGDTEEVAPRIAAPIIDPCNPNPCRANGRCEVDQGSSNGFWCRCPSNRRGIRCQTRVSIP